MTDLQSAGEAEGSAASLAAAVLDEEAARQAAQARAKEQVIFPDDLLPGVNSEPVNFRDAFAAGGVAMFVVLGLLVSLDQLTLNAVQTIEPELRQTFHISSGAVVFITSASSLFYALGADPDGLARRPDEAGADRRRAPRCSRAVFTFLSGLAGSAFILFWVALPHRRGQGEQHRRAPAPARRQLPDRHPGPHVGGDEHRPRRCSAT